jgi:hypothetical protein
MSLKSKSCRKLAMSTATGTPCGCHHNGNDVDGRHPTGEFPFHKHDTTDDFDPEGRSQWMG